MIPPVGVLSAVGIMARCIDHLACFRDILAPDEAFEDESIAVSRNFHEVYWMTDVATRDSLTRSMIELVAGMARSLVDLPDEVSCLAAPDNDGTVLLLRVAPADLGKVIGKQGRTARSIRTILGAASMKAQHRFSLDIQRVENVPG